MTSLSKFNGFLLWLLLVSDVRAFRAHLWRAFGSTQRSSPIVAAGTPDAHIITGQEHEGGLSLSPLVADIVESKTIAVHSMTMAMKARGEEVVSLAVGEPDFDPPQVGDSFKDPRANLSLLSRMPREMYTSKLLCNHRLTIILALLVILTQKHMVLPCIYPKYLNVSFKPSSLSSTFHTS